LKRKINTIRLLRLYLFTLVSLLIISDSTVSVYAQEKVFLSITIDGVYDSNISLLPLLGESALQPIITTERVRKGIIARMEVSEKYLPGEFVLRFDYRQTESDEPYPAEKFIIINDQDLDLWVHPLYSNNPDSTWFQMNERENNTYSQFLTENSKRRAALSLLQNLLLNYDNANTEFYRSGIDEYASRRIIYNKWIKSKARENKKLFVSKLFGFEYIPEIHWNGSDKDRKQSFRENYFEGMDFHDPILLKTSKMKQWMDRYVNLYGELATTIEMRDSLFTFAGRKAIEAVKEGDPEVYGWMVDYFFDGYESFNIAKGISMLEPYVNDPNCLSAKSENIRLRIEGLKTLAPGVLAPNFSLKTSEDQQFDLYNSDLQGRFTLLLFWSADCNHCTETIRGLHKWYSTKSSGRLLDIVTISLDESEQEITAWKESIGNYPGWTHLLTAKGVRSKVVSDYYIVGIPVMILINTETKELEYIPETVEQLISYLTRH